MIKGLVCAVMSAMCTEQPPAIFNSLWVDLKAERHAPRYTESVLVPYIAIDQQFANPIRYVSVVIGADWPQKTASYAFLAWPKVKAVEYEFMQPSKLIASTVTNRSIPNAYTEADFMGRRIAIISKSEAYRCLSVWKKLLNLNLRNLQISPNLSLSYSACDVDIVSGSLCCFPRFGKHTASLSDGDSQKHNTDGRNTEQPNGSPSHIPLRYQIGLLSVILLAVGIRVSFWGSKPDNGRWFHLLAFVGGGALFGIGVMCLIFATAGLQG